MNCDYLDFLLLFLYNLFRGSEDSIDLFKPAVDTIQAAQCPSLCAVRTACLHSLLHMHQYVTCPFSHQTSQSATDSGLAVRRLSYPIPSSYSHCL